MRPPITNRRRLLAALLALALVGSLWVVPAAATTQETTVQYDGDRLTVAAAPNQTVVGTTDLEPGTTLTVRVRSAGDQPFLKSAEATVEESGRFEVVFDFSVVEPGAEFTLTIAETDTEVEGVVVEPGTPASSPALGTNIQRLSLGDTEPWNVSVGNGEAFFAVGDGDSLVIQLDDANDDGRVTVLVDGTDPTEPPTLRVAAPDRYELVRQGSLDPLSERDQYDVSLSERVDGDPVDIGTLVVADDGSTVTAVTPVTHDPTTPTVTPSPSFLAENGAGIAGAVAVVLGLAALVRTRR